MDPLSKNSIYEVSNNQNAIIDAFEAAASSFAVNHKIPGAKFYHPKKEEEKPKSSDQRFDQDSILQFDENSSEQEDSLAPQQVIHTNHNQERFNIQPKSKEIKQHQTPEISFSENSKLPIPSNSVVYPPPMLDETDPDQIRLLHSWYWAGYYTGLADGKKFGSIK